MHAYFQIFCYKNYKNKRQEEKKIFYFICHYRHRIKIIKKSTADKYRHRLLKGHWILLIQLYSIAEWHKVVLTSPIIKLHPGSSFCPHTTGPADSCIDWTFSPLHTFSLMTASNIPVIVCTVHHYHQPDAEGPARPQGRGTGSAHHRRAHNILPNYAACEPHTALWIRIWIPLDPKLF